MQIKMKLSKEKQARKNARNSRARRPAKKLMQTKMDLSKRMRIRKNVRNSKTRRPARLRNHAKENQPRKGENIKGNC